MNRHYNKRTIPIGIERLEERICLSMLRPAFQQTRADATGLAQISRDYGQLPLSFEFNQGQVDPEINFLARGKNYGLYLTPTQAILVLQDSSRAGDVIGMQLVGANPSAQASGQDLLPGVSNYLIGNDPSQWHTNIPTYAGVAYDNVYPGVKLVYYGNNQGRLEYDLVVSPGADPQTIQLAFTGVENLSLDSSGNLVVRTAGGDLTEQAPSVYQDLAGARHLISARYVLEPGNRVCFQLAAYDPTQPLVIDPTYSLVYSTYLGGSGGASGNSIAVDSSGDAYVTGIAFDSFPLRKHLFPRQPLSSSVPARYAGSGDVFVAKLNAQGTGLVYSTYIGGSGIDFGKAIAVDKVGNVYITGNTNSPDFPTMNAYQSIIGHYLNGNAIITSFVTELNSTGSGLRYSSFLGGSNGGETGWGIALDRSGNAYVTGATGSTDFPTTPGAYQKSLTDATDTFVAKLNTSLGGHSSLVYSTYLPAGPGNIGAIEGAYGIAVDGSGNAYVTGYTKWSVFVTKLNAAGSALVYSTTFGGSEAQEGKAIAVNAAGEAFVTGWTYSTDFPTTGGAFQTAYPGLVCPFVTKLSTSGSVLYSTFLDGTKNSLLVSDDTGNGIAVDSAGDAYVTGLTSTTNFPTVNAFQTSYGGIDSDAFVTELNPTGSGLVYSTYLGGSDTDAGLAVAVDGSGNTYVTGYTASTEFPTTTGAFQTQLNAAPGTSNAFVTKIDPPVASQRGALDPPPPSPNRAKAASHALASPQVDLGTMIAGPATFPSPLSGLIEFGRLVPPASQARSTPVNSNRLSASRFLRPRGWSVAITSRILSPRSATSSFVPAAMY